MVIEWLAFEMAPENRQRFIETDTEIWTTALRQYPGFVSKEIWLDPAVSNRVIEVIRWSTREAWKAIPEAELTAVTQEFDRSLGFDYAMVDSREFQVRRFSADT